MPAANGHSNDETGPVLAELNFVRPMTVEPLLDVTGARRGNLDLEPHQVELTDADAADPAPSLASHGFSAIPFSAAFPDGGVDAAYRQYFANLAAAAVKEETGATLVIGVAATVQLRRSDGADRDGPISLAHTDFTPTSGAKRAQQILTRIGEKARPTRFAAFNVWWLGRNGPQDRPLALCDSTTIAAPDLQVGRAHVIAPSESPVDFGEIALQRYSERQRWYWYPRLGPDRLLLFCGFDSDSSRPSMVTHSAFANPDCPPGTPPRVSVECRCFAFW